MNEETFKVYRMIEKVSDIHKYHKKIEKIKGETFNIFSILNVESKENRTHSKFIAELLDPAGSHFMGSVFLKEFFKQICYDGPLNPDKARIHTEFYISKRTNIDGGRIDILISDNQGYNISIENKIYAGDQENQLIRYYNYAKDRNTLYYLTLHGKNASCYSTEFVNDECEIILKDNEHYYPISYTKDILNWLEACHRIASDVPQLRESIKQYKLLIKKLTGQLNTDKMNNELMKLMIKNRTNFEAVRLIHDNFDKAQNELYRNRVKLFKDYLIKEGFENESVNIERSSREIYKDGVFVIIKKYVINDEVWDLGLNFEFKNNYYFFCMVKEGENRNDKINGDNIFNAIAEELIVLFKDHALGRNGFTIGMSKQFIIAQDVNDILYNEETLKTMATQTMQYYDAINK